MRTETKAKITLPGALRLHSGLVEKCWQPEQSVELEMESSRKSESLRRWAASLKTGWRWRWGQCSQGWQAPQGEDWGAAGGLLRCLLAKPISDQAHFIRIKSAP